MSGPTILITRPRAEAEALAGVLAEKGWSPLIEPLLEIVPLATALPDLSGFRALVFTSAQGVRAYTARSGDRHLPVYAVGPATEAVAREAGFAAVTMTGGDIAALNCWLAQEKTNNNKPVLHVCGVHTAGTVEGAAVRLPIYEARAAQNLTVECLAALDRGGVAAALFFSPRTGEIMTKLLKKYGRTNAANPIKALCLSDSVVQSVRFLPWRDVQAAPTPDMAGMMTLLEQA